MTARRLPVRPDLDQLKRQAKELLKAIRRGDQHCFYIWMVDQGIAIGESVAGTASNGYFLQPGLIHIHQRNNLCPSHFLG